ncbi:MAG TPA: hypothetical protein VGQ76_14605 [Thermoanaerobaculia bacterium]|nr:hypothetical protein [Thermoanaerobaculia bacterium]
MIVLAFVLAAVTATVSPPEPKVGDLITIVFPAPVTIEKSPSFEVVEQVGNRVIVRTFQPEPFTVNDVVVPVKSVLAPDDALAPAPLAPPLEVPYPRAPFLAIALAAFAALATWLAVWWRAKHVARPAIVAPSLTAEERFRNAVSALRRDEHPRRWAALADETRAFLAATRQLGSELTTHELVPQLAARDAVVEDILRHGDYEKFAPGGRPAADFEEVAEKALGLAEIRG